MMKHALIRLILPLLLISCQTPSSKSVAPSSEVLDGSPASETMPPASTQTESTEPSWIDTEVGLDLLFDIAIVQPPELGWTFEYFTVQFSLGCHCHMEWKSYQNDVFVEESTFDADYEVHYNIEWGYGRTDLIVLDSRRVAMDPYGPSKFTLGTERKTLFSVTNSGPHDHWINVDGQPLPIFLMFRIRE